MRILRGDRRGLWARYSNEAHYSSEAHQAGDVHR